MGQIITSGILKGMSLKVAAGGGTRPTGGKVRAAIFNSLQDDLDDSFVLDLCAGSGGMGLEALSRGASRCVMVESSSPAARIIKTNIEEARRRFEKQNLPFPRVRLLRQDVAKPIPPMDFQFDLVFCDPPYAEAVTIVPAAFEAWRRHLAKDATIVLEFAASTELATPFGYELEREKVYGDSRVSFFSIKQ